MNVLVNPMRPEQAVLTRGGASGLIVYAVPPFFFMLGLVGATFTTAGALGWLDERSRHPFGRAVRSFGRWFLQEKILKTVLFTVFGAVITALVIGGIRSGNFILIGVAAIVGWGLWQASRKRPR